MDNLEWLHEHIRPDLSKTSQRGQAKNYFDHESRPPAVRHKNGVLELVEEAADLLRGLRIELESLKRASALSPKGPSRNLISLKIPYKRYGTTMQPLKPALSRCMTNCRDSQQH